jgi:hypothetical protein
MTDIEGMCDRCAFNGDCTYQEDFQTVHCCASYKNKDDPKRTPEAYEARESMRQHIDQLEARNRELVGALNDIAKGMVPPEFLNDIEKESPAEFRGRMWGWSQERARQAIAKEA